jgi:hypothetical protein
MSGQHSEEGKRKRQYRSAAQRKEAARELDRMRNRMAYRGQKLAVEHLREALHICAAAMANVCPIHNDGERRVAGNQEEFFQCYPGCMILPRH